jgi:hypothetical protein
MEDNRKYIIQFVFILVGLIYCIKLFQIQSARTPAAFASARAGSAHIPLGPLWIRGQGSRLFAWQVTPFRASAEFDFIRYGVNGQEDYPSIISLISMDRRIKLARGTITKGFAHNRAIPRRVVRKRAEEQQDQPRRFLIAFTQLSKASMSSLNSLGPGTGVRAAAA